MGPLRERLQAMGIRLFEGGFAQVRPELARVAGIVHRRGCRSLGLVPATDDVGVPAIALETAVALAQLTGGTAGVVDADATWSRPDEPARERGAAAGATWLADRVAVLTPAAAPEGPRAETLRACLTGEDALALTHLVVDLTGLDRTGEHLEAIDLLDGVAVVARAGRTSAAHVARWMSELPGAKNLGVLLVGG